MPTGHYSTIFDKRMLLLHFVLEGCYIDVGFLSHKIIVDRALSEGKNVSPLIFPILITALCREAQVRARPTDAKIKKKIETLPAQVLGLKGLVHDVVVTPDGMSTNLAANVINQLQPYFKSIHKRDIALGALFKELLSQSTITLLPFPEELLNINNDVLDAYQPPPYLL
ncbi:hypothetical protein V6N13_042831 [Hibiscus sabdariffa]|uniref:Uncharacterized protein n=1 Tax=Hibiscus sabdariffa TaxID=183260 RepID=A0ABR2G3G7_9ROSI